MHEYKLALDIINTAENHARQNSAKRVSAINLVVGEYSGCVADSIALYFEIIAQGSLCDGAELNIERVKPKLKCEKCGVLFDRLPFSFACPDEGCGGEGIPTEIGREFFIRSVVVS